MSHHSEFDSFAGIHFRNLETATINGYGNPRLRSELAARGVGTFIIPGVKSYNFEDNSLTVHPLASDDLLTLKTPIELPLNEGVDVIRARVATPRHLEEVLPVLNGNRLREIGGSKWRQYEIAGDLMPKTVAIEADTRPLTAAFDALEGEQLVVKADMSQDMQFFRLAARDEVIPTILGMRREFDEKEKTTGRPRANKRILVQEFAQGVKWPELTATDDASADLMHRAENTELRIYCYVDTARTIPVQERYFATGRSFHDGTDDWFSVEQASVPKQAWAIADTVSDRMLEAAGVPGGYFAIDLFRTNDDRYMIREINTRDPMMVSEAHGRADAHRQRQLLAGVMATLAHKVYNKR